MLVGPHEFDWQTTVFQIFRSKIVKEKKKTFLIDAFKNRIDIFYLNVYLNT